MAEVNPKIDRADTADEKGLAYSANGTSDVASQVCDRPTGLKGLYYHPLTQTCLLAMICFMCPGLFNALTGLGAGGQIDATTSANSLAAHYSTFAAAAFFAGSINNKLGPRLTLLIGSAGYSLYVGSYLAISLHPNLGAFVITVGTFHGICAGLLWTAQGSLMLSYPTESQKGRYIGVFWAIFNLGSVVGSSVSLGQNFHSKSNSVGNGTYIGFLVLTLIGTTIPFLMADPNKMIRTDGTKVTTRRNPSWKTEIQGLWTALRTDPLIILLFPMFFVSNWFYTWQFNDYNGALFNIRARSLNNLVYWMSQIFGSLAMGFLLDRKNVGRRARAFSGWTALFGMIFVVHIWAYFYQRNYTRASIPPAANKMDIYDNGYVAKIWLYIFCGLLDAMWQSTAYWLMGAMSNDSSKLAHFTGFYKSLQSAGAAGVWRADAVKLPFMNIFISTWVLLVSGLIFALPVIHLRVKEHTEITDDALTELEYINNAQQLDGPIQPEAEGGVVHRVDSKAKN